MDELVVISGKGGTGKTSVVAALARLAAPCVLADCDVDAADLHLLLEPRVICREDFVGGGKARIEPARCMACGTCQALCRFDAIHCDGPGHGLTERTFRVDATACEGCGVCADHCAQRAIEFAPAICGQWLVSETRCGPMVHARLGIAAENSGKLVTQVRQAARQVAADSGLDLLLCDGSPGIGCPVVASLTGASLALYVVEPTVSGVHDFHRVARVASRLNVPGLLAVNKADLNPGMAEKLEAAAVDRGVILAGRIPYDRGVTEAQIARQTVIEASDGPAAGAIRRIWAVVEEQLRARGVSGRGALVQIVNPGNQEVLAVEP